MTPLLTQILAGCVVVLFAAALKLLESTRRQVNQLKLDVRTLTGEFAVLKEYWIRTAERRDSVVKEAQRWKTYALKVQGIDPRLLDLPAEAVCEAKPDPPAATPPETML